MPPPKVRILKSYFNTLELAYLKLQRMEKGLSSPAPSPSTATPQATPSPLPTNVLNSANYETFEAWCRSLSGMQLWECSRIASMVMLTHINGATGIPVTPPRRPTSGSSEAFNSVPPPARSSRKSTLKGAKSVLSEAASLPQFNSPTERARYANWIHRAKRTDCEDNRRYWMSRWGSKGFQGCRETSAGTAARSPS